MIHRKEKRGKTLFACSVKFSKKRILGIIAIATAIAVLMVALALYINKSHEIEFNGGDEYLSACGFSSELIAEDEIIIPENFNSVYQEYNEMQKDQGFDLQDYAGETCIKYTYRITNADDDIQAIFLVFNGKLIGGDVHQQRYGGWIEPLKTSYF